MKSLGIINSDGMYSNLGLMLSDQCIHTIKLAVFVGTEKVIFKDRIEFNGSLLKQLNDAYSVIDRYNRTRAEYNGLYRIDIRDYPEESVRETLLNALVHRDYSFSGSTLISIFDDRIEILSLGGLVKGITYNDIMLGASILRNKKLGNIFYRLRLIEAYGTGIPKIINSYKEYSVKPQIKISDNAFKIILPNTNPATINIKEIHLSDNEQATLLLFNNNTFVTRKEIEEQINMSQSMVISILNSLFEKGLIKKLEKCRNTRYQAKKSNVL